MLGCCELACTGWGAFLPQARRDRKRTEKKKIRIKRKKKRKERRQTRKWKRKKKWERRERRKEEE